jgi:spore coat protein A
MTKYTTVTRRQLFVRTAAVGAALAVPWYFNGGTAFAFYQSMGLRKFIQPLRGIGPGGIPVVAPDAFRAPVTRVTHYSLSIRQFKDQLHPDLGPTTLWGYNPVVPLGGGMQPARHLGGIFVVPRGKPIQVTFTNRLPSKHILPVDTSANFPDAQKHQNAVTTHLHGGFTPWTSDGGPFTWYTPDGQYGPSVHSAKGNIYKLLNPHLRPGQAEYYYTNDQSARLVWYHDHAHDLTRLNAYAGVASAYIIRDSFEDHLRNRGLPDFVENGGREIPIIIQDKIFVGPDIGQKDPGWHGLTEVGSLWYAHTYEQSRWQLGPHPLGMPPDPSVVPEMFGDTMLANGTVYPEATVEARRYRLRVLNGCQARFLNLQLYVDDGSPDGITLENQRPTNVSGPDFFVLGTEGGFLPKPVYVPSNQPFNPLHLSGSLITGPAERWDLLVDFSGFTGKKIILYNDAPAPFPTGAPVNDYFPGAPDNPTQPSPGFGPNTRQIMRFKVVPATSQDQPLRITSKTSLVQDLDPFLVPPGTAVQNGMLHLPPGVKVRQLTLSEPFDGYGRQLQLLGTNRPVVNGSFGRAYMDPATETPKKGSIEVWQIANLTGNTHPIHFHLVNVQVLGRQPFNVSTYNGTPSYTDIARDPDKTELGWKETVRMDPGEVTTVIMRFRIPTVPFTVPASPRTGGHEYVWHCHILEHEEHDMMRPLVIM